MPGSLWKKTRRREARGKGERQAEVGRRIAERMREGKQPQQPQPKQQQKQKEQKGTEGGKSRGISGAASVATVASTDSATTRTVATFSSYVNVTVFSIPPRAADVDASWRNVIGEEDGIAARDDPPSGLAPNNGPPETDRAPRCHPPPR